MSTSKQALQDFSKQIVNHAAYDEVINRVRRSLFDKWVKGSDDERKVIGDISNALDLVIGELDVVFASIDDDKPVNDEEHDDA